MHTYLHIFLLFFFVIINSTPAFSCFFSRSCTWNGSQKDLAEHAQEKHRVWIFDHLYINVDVEASLEQRVGALGVFYPSEQLAVCIIKRSHVMDFYVHSPNSPENRRIAIVVQENEGKPERKVISISGSEIGFGRERGRDSHLFRFTAKILDKKGNFHFFYKMSWQNDVKTFPALHIPGVSEKLLENAFKTPITAVREEEELWPEPSLGSQPSNPSLAAELESTTEPGAQNTISVTEAFALARSAGDELFYADTPDFSTHLKAKKLITIQRYLKKVKEEINMFARKRNLYNPPLNEDCLFNCLIYASSKEYSSQNIADLKTQILGRLRGSLGAILLEDTDDLENFIMKNIGRSTWTSSMILQIIAESLEISLTLITHEDGTVNTKVQGNKEKRITLVNYHNFHFLTPIKLSPEIQNTSPSPPIEAPKDSNPRRRIYR